MEKILDIVENILIGLEDRIYRIDGRVDDEYEKLIKELKHEIKAYKER